MHEKYKVGDKVRVWIGALTGSPGTPGPDAVGWARQITDTNDIGQVRVSPLGDPDPVGVNSRWVYRTAILGHA